MIRDFNQLLSLRNVTFNDNDRDKILDAMLPLATYSQLLSLRNATFNDNDRGKILDAMLLSTNTQSNKNLINSNLPLKTYDLFIAHASEDKDFVTPLALSLIERGVKVWYDDFILKLGYSLRREIDKGLSQSNYGLVILSHNFFAKHWPQKELDGLASQENIDRKVIIPVWHKINKDDILNYSPTLADIVAIKSSMGVKTIAERIIIALDKRI